MSAERENATTKAWQQMLPIHWSHSWQEEAKQATGVVAELIDAGSAVAAYTSAAPGTRVPWSLWLRLVEAIRRAKEGSK